LRNLGSLEFIVCTGDRKKVWSCIVYRLLHVREKVTSACRRYFLSAVLNRALWSPVCIYIYRLTTSPLIYICPGVSLCVANAVLSPYLPGAFYMSTANSEIQNQTVEIKSHCLFYAVHVEPQSWSERRDFECSYLVSCQRDHSLEKFVSIKFWNPFFWNKTTWSWQVISHVHPLHYLEDPML
jgi:hypothetical protein